MYQPGSRVYFFNSPEIVVAAFQDRRTNSLQHVREAAADVAFVVAAFRDRRTNSLHHVREAAADVAPIPSFRDASDPQLDSTSIPFPFRLT